MGRAIFLTAVDPEEGGSGDACYSASVLHLMRATGLFDDVTVVLTRAANGTSARSLRRAYAFERALVSPLPIKFHTSVAPGRQAALAREIAAPDVALVVFNHPELLGLACHVEPGVPMVLVSHNLEHRLWRERAANDPQFPRWMRPLMARDARKFVRLETEEARRVRNVWSISRDDAEHFDGLGPAMNVIAVPPVFAGELPNGRRGPAGGQAPVRLGFLGKLSWWPNEEGAAWLMREVVPHVDPRHVSWHFFGGGSERLDGAAPNVFGHGFVASIDAVWDGMDVMVCPIFSGGGVNVKFGEALFRGRPVIATSFAGRGLAPIADPAVRFIDDAAGWISLLDGAGIRRLAATPPARATRSLFAQDAYVPAVAGFLRQALGQAPADWQPAQAASPLR